METARISLRRGLLGSHWSRSVLRGSPPEGVAESTKTQPVARQTEETTRSGTGLGLTINTSIIIQLNLHLP